MWMVLQLHSYTYSASLFISTKKPRSELPSVKLYHLSPAHFHITVACSPRHGADGFYIESEVYAQELPFCGRNRRATLVNKCIAWEIVRDDVIP
jgi:hypothetical protein